MDTAVEGLTAEGIRRRRHGDFSIVLAIATIGLALRWARLDLIPFTYDAAEALGRARETLALGHPPGTGIVNSLGFRNPGGFIWMLLPAALVSPDPRWTTAWIGLLGLTGLWPLWRISGGGGTFSGGPGGWARYVPPLLYAVHPAMVAGGRHIWAQNLMPAFGAWALWAVMTARERQHHQAELSDPSDETNRRDFAVPESDPAGRARRGAAAAVAMALLTVSATVHLSGAAYLAAAAVLLYRPWRASRFAARWVVGGAAACALVAASAVPSALDFLDAQAHPRPKPDFVAAFEAKVELTVPFPSRLSAAIAGPLPSLASGAALGGLQKLLSDSETYASSVADQVLLIAVLAGLARVMLRLHHLGGRAILAGWFLVPAGAALAGIMHINATYFAPGFPLVLLLAGVGISTGPRCSGKSWIPAVARTGAVLVWAIVYPATTVAAFAGWDRSRAGDGVARVPLADQMRVARRLAAEGVGASRLVHLSGDWYGRSYEYLLRETTTAGAAGIYAMMDDEGLRASIPGQLDWMRRRMPDRIGPVRWTTVETAAYMNQAMRDYAKARTIPGGTSE